MFADPIVHKQGNNLHVTHGDDSQTYVEFRREAVQSGYKSEQAGHPVYDDVDYIKIMFPGDKTKVLDRPVNDLDKQRFPNQWRQYQETGAVVQSGTPITEWPPLTKGQAMTFKGIGVHTVENLAAMSDHGLDQILGARELREKARLYLESATGSNAAISQLMAKVEQLTIDNQAMKDQLLALGNPELEEKRKPGRPKLAA